MVIDHTGDAVLAANVDYVLGDGAKLTVVAVQDWDDNAVHVAQHNTLVGRDASFKSVVVTFGGDWSGCTRASATRPPVVRPN